jgi:hypothetical protein
MARPLPGDVHVDGVLTRISIAYSNPEYIAGQIFPVVPVENQSGYYFVFDKGPWFRMIDTLRAPGTRAIRADYTLTTGTFFCDVYAVAKGIPDETRQNASAPLRPDVDATRFITDQLLRSLERRVASLVTTAAYWAYSTSPTTQWSSSTSDPISDIETARNAIVQAIGRMPNTMVMSYDVWRHLKSHPDLMDRLKYTNPTGVITVEQARTLFGVDRLLIGNAVYDAAKEGQSASHAYIWGDGVWLGYVPNSPGLMEPAAGYVFEWQSMGSPRQVYRYREIAEHQDVVEVQHATDEKITASDAGAVLRDVV